RDVVLHVDDVQVVGASRLQQAGVDGGDQVAADRAVVEVVRLVDVVVPVGARGSAAPADAVAGVVQHVHVGAVDDVAQEAVQAVAQGVVGGVGPVGAQVKRLGLHVGQD